MRLFLIISSCVVCISASLPVFAGTLPTKVKQDIIDAKEMLPVKNGQRMVSLCGNHVQPKIFRNRSLPRDIPNIAIMRALAEKGNSVAQCALGHAYSFGFGDTKEDRAEAANWYRRAAVQGNIDAQSALAQAYDGGNGVKQDPVQAVEWYRKAAEQGDGYAQATLADHYARGTGVTQNDAEALKWYRRAAEQGAISASRFLMQSYREGIHGLPKDYVQAYKWRLIDLRRYLVLFTLSGVPTDEDLKDLAKYEQGMSAEQIAEAKRLADEWKPKYESSYWDIPLDELIAKH